MKVLTIRNCTFFFRFIYPIKLHKKRLGDIISSTRYIDGTSGKLTDRIGEQCWNFKKFKGDRNREGIGVSGLLKWFTNMSSLKRLQIRAQAGI
jgi:hypothetical protein